MRSITLMIAMTFTLSIPTVALAEESDKSASGKEAVVQEAEKSRAERLAQAVSEAETSRDPIHYKGALRLLADMQHPVAVRPLNGGTGRGEFFKDQKDQAFRPETLTGEELLQRAQKAAAQDPEKLSQIEAEPRPRHLLPPEKDWMCIWGQCHDKFACWQACY